MANTFKLITKAGVTSADVIYTVAGLVIGLAVTMSQTKMSSW